MAVRRLGKKCYAHTGQLFLVVDKHKLFVTTLFICADHQMYFLIITPMNAQINA